MKYTGIIAIFVYLTILIIYMKFFKKNDDEKNEPEVIKEVKRNVEPLDPNDEDAMVACLVAAIECRNEYHRNVRIVSVKEV